MQRKITYLTRWLVILSCKDKLKNYFINWRRLKKNKEINTSLVNDNIKDHYKRLFDPYNTKFLVVLEFENDDARMVFIITLI